ncbi:hypothetical protein BDB01DRAFT_736064 [Pilobolus umbonatus]|nr:hypothetical protein BDB01DRAFT_736064 [Pilobolus umbonatus]
MHTRNEHGAYHHQDKDERHCCSDVAECCAEKGLYVGRPFYTQKKYWIILAFTSLLSIFAVGYLAAYTAFPKVAEDVVKKMKVDMSDFTLKNDVNMASVSGNKLERRKLDIIPVLAKPAVQLIVDGSILTFDNIVLSKPTNTGFTVQMKGAIVSTGPFDAAISFPTPLTVSWKSKKLGTVTMPAINAKAIVGAKFDVPGTFVVTSESNMAEFATYMINNKYFIWKIESDDVTVKAIDMTFTKIRLTKLVTLDGADGFEGAVKIKSFDLPSNHADGGITLIAKTTISNPSQIGFSLDGAAFDSYFGSVLLGPLASDGDAVFSPKGTNEITMKGRLVKQTTTAGIDALTQVFSNFLSAKSTSLTIKGASGSGPNGQVSWLTTAFKSLSISKVVLPGPASKPELIEEISLRNMQLDFTGDVWNPPTGSSKVEATLKNPFGFPLAVKELNMAVKADYNGDVVATLDIPKSQASTNDKGVVTTQFSNVPFKVQDKTKFTGFVQLLTSSPEVTFGLAGTSNAVAQTAAGTINLPTISFDVDTVVHGLHNFGGSAKLLSTKVVGATAQYVLIDIEVEISNPSNITISVGDINFDVLLPEFGNAKVGRVFLNKAVIAAGSKTYAGQMRLGENASSSAAISAVLTGYLTAGKATLDIKGTDQSTAIVPLNPALKSVKLSTDMTGIEPQLIKKIDINITDLEPLLEPNGIVYTNIDLYNPLDTPFTINQISAAVEKDCKCYVCVGQKVTLGKVVYDLPTPLTVPPKTTVKTGLWPVTLNANLDEMLALMADFYDFYDVKQNATVVVGDAFNTGMNYFQNKVPYSLYVAGITEVLYPGLCEDLTPSPTSRSAPVSFKTIEDVKDFIKAHNGDK